MQQNADALLAQIVQQSGKPHDEIARMVDEKEFEFSGLVSRVGAIYIVAKELGLELAQTAPKDLKIENIVSDMKKVNFFGKIVYISPVKEFKLKEGDGNGKVMTVVLGDETGTIRMSLWGEKTEVEGKIKAGDVLEVIGGYTKTDYKGQPEVRLGKFGNLRIVENMDIHVKEQEVRGNYDPTTIKEMTETEKVQLKAQLVQIYERKLVYYMCPQCNKRLGSRKCEEHGVVDPKKLLIVNGVVDDGTGTANVVFFNEAAEQILGKKIDEIVEEVQMSGEKQFFDNLQGQLGDQYNLKGLVKRNDMTKNLEVTIHNIKPLNAVAEINALLGELKTDEEEIEV